MTLTTGRRRAFALGCFALAIGLASGCTSSTKSMVARDFPTVKTSGKEYFSESAYGVKASPRVSNLRSNLPRGGGRDQTGKPYQVRGKWYYPKEDKTYSKKGGASWYGDAFHGRLTANGEIYDMTHLTAAHPTMPLPSYARVTNLKTGASVIVRVNDRGPYAEGRIIDLSRQAAMMLGYAQDGIATVQVDYVGRAPLEGHDDSYLMASYKPGNANPDPSDGLPTGVMVAMNGSTPSAQKPAQAFPGQLTEAPATRTAAVAAPVPAAPAFGETVELPSVAPALAPRPQQVALATMGYAAGPSDLSNAFAKVKGGSSWKKGPAEYVAAATLDNEKAARNLAAGLQAFGRVEVVETKQNGRIWRSVNLYNDGRYGIDDMLRAAWDHGAADALAVRD